jgi:hypothetical protein
LNICLEGGASFLLTTMRKLPCWLPQVCSMANQVIISHTPPTARSMHRPASPPQKPRGCSTGSQPMQLSHYGFNNQPPPPKAYGHL